MFKIVFILDAVDHYLHRLLSTSTVVTAVNVVTVVVTVVTAVNVVTVVAVVTVVDVVTVVTVLTVVTGFSVVTAATVVVTCQYKMYESKNVTVERKILVTLRLQPHQRSSLLRHPQRSRNLSLKDPL